MTSVPGSTVPPKELGITSFLLLLPLLLSPQGLFSFLKTNSLGLMLIKHAYFPIRDTNCGKAFNAARDDTALGGVNRCVRPNPKVGVTKPSTRLVCTGGRRGNKELKSGGGSWNGSLAVEANE